jgi:antitoxin MazE
MHTNAKILKWGNSLGIRLSGALRGLTDFKAGTVVDVEIKADGLFIRKVKQKTILPFSESALLNGLDEKNHQDLIVKPQGNEWHD